MWYRPPVKTIYHRTGHICVWLFVCRWSCTNLSTAYQLLSISNYIIVDKGVIITGDHALILSISNYIIVDRGVIMTGCLELSNDGNNLHDPPPHLSKMLKMFVSLSVCNLCKRMSWSTVSKAVDRSRRTKITALPWSLAHILSLCILNMTISVLWCFI